MNKITKIFFILCFCLVSFCEASFAAEWKEVCNLAQGTYYVDIASIKRTRNTIIAWVKHIDKTSSKVCAFSLSKAEFNTENDTVTVLNYRAYDNNGKFIHGAKTNIIYDILPDHPMALVYEFCKKQTRHWWEFNK